MAITYGRYGLKCYSFDAVIHGDCTVLCVSCLPDGISPNADDCSPIFADSEWDSYPVCDKCGRVIDYVNLISEG